MIASLRFFSCDLEPWSNGRESATVKLIRHLTHKESLNVEKIDQLRSYFCISVSYTCVRQCVHRKYIDYNSWIIYVNRKKFDAEMKSWKWSLLVYGVLKRLGLSLDNWLKILMAFMNFQYKHCEIPYIKALKQYFFSLYKIWKSNGFCHSYFNWNIKWQVWLMHF